jgi:nicotinate (nicotinamide) nucleotide adenylyltransferase
VRLVQRGDGDAQEGQVGLGGLLGPIAFAFYNVGKRIEMAFVSLAQSFAQALFQPLFAARRDPTERAAVLRQALGLVTVTCGAGAAVFIATADLVIALLLGQEWAPAAPVAALLAVAGHSRALAAACASLLSVSGQNLRLLRVSLASAGIGLAMVALAVAGRTGWRASDVELRHESPSYTTITLQRFRERGYAPTELFFLIGADAFSEIETWFRWHDVLEQVEFLVLSRPGYTYDIPDGARVHRLETLQLDVSSTAIRRRLAAGETPPELPPAVLQYIRQHGLYTD